MLINRSAVITVTINIDGSDPRADGFAAAPAEYSFFTFLIGSKVLIDNSRLEWWNNKNKNILFNNKKIKCKENNQI